MWMEMRMRMCSGMGMTMGMGICSGIGKLSTTMGTPSSVAVESISVRNSQ